ncbi:MAG: chromosome partitioning protein ParB, partial [Muribaculaceae bacterium]|nr:chromosome partitioning protein ParB [Muribaculaceae bacterium]
RLSERVGKKRTTIANFLRLLRLPAEVQLGLRDKRLDMGHARALLSIEDPSVQLKLYNDIVKNGLSVRRVEELARQWQENKSKNQDEDKKNTKSSIYSSHDFDILKKHLSATFNTNVNFTMDRNGKGKITFPFKNDEELAKLICIFDNINQNQTEG